VLRLECGRICSIHPSLPSMANPIARAFGHRVRKLRTERRISQEELADRCGVHRTYMGRIERGETNITLTNIHKVARGLGVPVAALVDETKGGYERAKGSERSD
jgi:transcriptional regulator with XRE-family HTH domain